MSAIGRGRGTGGRGCGRGNHKARGGGPTGATKKKGLCAALGEHIFIYNEKGAAYQMRNTLKQIVNHTGTIYGLEISNELHNRIVVIIAKPQHTADVLRKHEAKVSLRDNNFQRIQDARIANEAVLITAAQTNTDLTIPLAELQNDKEDAAAKHSEPLDIILQGDAKVDNEGNWRTYQDSKSRLD